jgi:hypothetical protein
MPERKRQRATAQFRTAAFFGKGSGPGSRSAEPVPGLAQGKTRGLQLPEDDERKGCLGPGGARP